jgi:hypothetical protein
MGVYIYTLRKKSVQATVIGENKTVTVGFAEYFCKDSYDIHDCRFFKSGATKAKKLVETFKPDFYTTPLKNYTQNNIYKFKGFGMFSDTPDLGEFSGLIFISKKKYYIIPFDKTKEEYEVFYERAKEFISSFSE